MLEIAVDVRIAGARRWPIIAPTLRLRALAYIDGKEHETATGTPDELARAFEEIVDEYIESKYASANPG